MINITIKIHEIAPNDLIAEPFATANAATPLEREISNDFRIACDQVLTKWDKKWQERHGAAARIEGMIRVNPALKDVYKDL